MLGLNSRQRDVLADKVPEVANIITGAIVIGFSLGDSGASWMGLLVARSVWTAALFFALWVLKQRV